jgi:hypothetical protein
MVFDFGDYKQFIASAQTERFWNSAIDDSSVPFISAERGVLETRPFSGSSKFWKPAGTVESAVLNDSDLFIGGNQARAKGAALELPRRLRDVLPAFLLLALAWFLLSWLRRTAESFRECYDHPGIESKIGVEFEDNTDMSLKLART